jgi:hypothetical protein
MKYCITQPQLSTSEHKAFISDKIVYGRFEQQEIKN